MSQGFRIKFSGDVQIRITDPDRIAIRGIGSSGSVQGQIFGGDDVYVNVPAGTDSVKVDISGADQPFPSYIGHVTTNWTSVGTIQAGIAENTEKYITVSISSYTVVDPMPPKITPVVPDESGNYIFHGDGDLQAAKMIQAWWKINHGVDHILVPAKDLYSAPYGRAGYVIGGQYANGVFKHAVDNSGLDPVTEQHSVDTFIGRYNYIAAWSQADTLAVVSSKFASSEVIGSPLEPKRQTLRIFLHAWYQVPDEHAAIAQALLSVPAQITSLLPVGWSFVDARTGTGYVDLVFEETGTPILPIAVIVAAVAIALFGYGFIVKGWTLLEHEKTVQQRDMLKSEMINSCVASGKSLEECTGIVNKTYPEIKPLKDEGLFGTGIDFEQVGGIMMIALVIMLIGAVKK